MIYLKSVNIIHNDIKAENILISHDNQAKFIDFGCSRNIKEPIRKSFQAKNQQNNNFNGTIPWMAPEALMGNN